MWMFIIELISYTINYLGNKISKNFIFITEHK